MVLPIKRKGAKATTQEPLIDDEFRSRIPPLTPEEAKLLEDSIIAEGCRDPLIVWCGKLVDGHHRLEICKRNNIPYKTVELQRENREAVLDWIDRNQLGRRNLHPDTASLLRGRVLNRQKQRLGGDRKSAEAKKSNAQSEHLKPGDTSKRLAKDFGVSRATVTRDGQYAAAVDTLKPIVPELEAQVIRGEGPPRKQVVEAAKVAQESPAKAKEILADSKPPHKPHVSQNSGNQEWYTQDRFIVAARKVMGSIDTDPASCPEANVAVKATKIHTVEDDGLKHEWTGNVWLNPPYGEPLISRFIGHLKDQLVMGNITQAIVLVNNCTETSWFQSLCKTASAICFPSGRISFWTTGRKSRNPLQGQAFFYIGDNDDEFIREFSQFGQVVIPVKMSPKMNAPEKKEPTS
jgi:ParB family chromosome partitioning protein